MAFERIGASSESLRVRNNDWFVYRSYDGRRDIKVLRVNTSDIIEFLYPPYVGEDQVALISHIESLTSRIEALEAGNTDAAQFDIFSSVITQEIWDLQQIELPHAPISAKIVMLIKETLPQFGLTDFGVEGNIVSWDGFDLPSILEIGDEVKFIYLYNL
jgi:hypothetical protein